MTTQTTQVTARELLSALPIVILARAVAEALGSRQRRPVIGQAARA